MLYAVAVKFFKKESPFITEAEDVRSAAEKALKELADNDEPMLSGTLLVVEWAGFDEKSFIKFIQDSIADGFRLEEYADFIGDYENEMSHEMAVAAAEWMKKKGRIFPDWDDAVKVTVGMQLTIEVQI